MPMLNDSEDGSLREVLRCRDTKLEETEQRAVVSTHQCVSGLCVPVAPCIEELEVVAPGLAHLEYRYHERVRVSRDLVSVAAVGSLLTGCLGPPAFSCSRDEQCDVGTGSRCIEGGCASPDELCPSGYRFGSDDRRSGTCASASAETGSETVDSFDPISTTRMDGSSETTSPHSTSDASSETTGAPLSTTGDQCSPDGCRCTVGLSVGFRHSCVTRTDGSVACWGRNEAGQLGIDGVGLSPQLQLSTFESPAIEVTAAMEHTCAVLSDGGVICWGTGRNGAIDGIAPEDPQQAPALPPTRVPGVVSATSVRLSAHASCALLEGDRFACWGRNFSGELMVSDGGSGPVQSGPHLDTPIEGFAMGGSSGCMWSGEALACWGSNSRGQLGSGPVGGSTAEPREVAVSSPPLEVAVGRQHACAIVLDGSAVECWGDNLNAQVTGAIDSLNSYAQPHRLEFGWPNDLAGIVAQRDTTCVRTTAEEVYCWGGVAGGKLGAEGVANGELLWPPARLAVADELPSAPGVVGLGFEHVCILDTDDALWCWGDNDYGQQGPLAPKAGKRAVKISTCAEG